MKHIRKIVQEKGCFPGWCCSCGETHTIVSKEEIATYDFLHQYHIRLRGVE